MKQHEDLCCLINKKKNMPLAYLDIVCINSVRTKGTEVALLHSSMKPKYSCSLTLLCLAKIEIRDSFEYVYKFMSGDQWFWKQHKQGIAMSVHYPQIVLDCYGLGCIPPKLVCWNLNSQCEQYLEIEISRRWLRLNNPDSIVYTSLSCPMTFNWCFN
jgi:hypothetical protein